MACRTRGSGMNDEAYLVVRFYGRFVFAYSEESGELTALAINMQTIAEDLQVDKHDAFMIIREGNVQRPVGQSHADGEHPEHQSERPPTYRIMPSNVVSYDGARLLWNVDQCKIDIPILGGFKWTVPFAEIKLADLKWLSDNRPLKKENRESVGGATSAIIQIHAGIGTALHQFDQKFNLMEYDYAYPGNTDVIRTGKRLADMVQVIVPLPKDSFDVTISDSTFGSAKNPETVTIKGSSFLPLSFPSELEDVEGLKGKRGVVITFSNLCTASPVGPQDREFAAFYEILDHPAPFKKRLVPQTKGAGRMIRFQGDCFLSATIIY